MSGHPGQQQYPPDEPRRRPGPTPHAHSGQSVRQGSGGDARPQYTSNHHLPPLEDTPTSADRRAAEEEQRRMPRKITVTRVAAMRSREITEAGIAKWHQATKADGADKSGLTALTYPVILNNAVDAAMMVALANTLFFAAAQAESKSKVALYLLVNIAPFAIIAPFMGPLLDRIQHGRRVALAASFGIRVALAVLLITNCEYDPIANTVNFDPWVLYPCALAMMVMSKSFSVLKSAVVPRVMPPSIDLARVNSRLTLFGLVVGSGVGGAIAAGAEFGLSRMLHIPGGMYALMVFAVLGAVMCMRIPKRVESTAGEVPTTLSYTGAMARDAERQADRAYAERGHDTEGSRAKLGAAFKNLRVPLGRSVVTGLWGNTTIRVLTGFLTLYVAFYSKAEQAAGGSATESLLMIGAVGAAAGIGNFIGNGIGARLQLPRPARIVVQATVAATVGAIIATVFGNLIVVAAVTFVASGVSALGKVSLDASIQDDLPDESRASAFGRSETALQLGWVGGAALGVLLPPTLWIGFATVAAIMVVGTVQTVLTYRGGSLIPNFGGKRPEHVPPTMNGV
ncbi:MFS family permease [Tsukamurella ocularis]|nr:MFS family permease [Tsukamurella ocularis]MCS3786868.1 MFS family permease [Tsukamurella ocularis]MCS3850710.1 MFS family permease [Tsukamurella ocularis]